MSLSLTSSFFDFFFFFFTQKSGTLAYCIDGEEGTLQEGESIVIPPYRPHTFWNDVASGTDLVVHITVRGGDNPGFDETFGEHCP